MDQSPAAAAQRLAFNKQALILAVKTGDTETVVDLLDGGVPIDTKDEKGMSLLHWAAQGGNVTTMRLLIRRGCDVDSADAGGVTPLHLAAAMGQTKTVRELIRKGASKSVVAGKFSTPLHLAAFNSHAETATAMLEEGCPIDAVDSDGCTVLHAAAEGGHVELVRELVDRGCDANAAESDGCTPLHEAAAWGRTGAVRELMKLGAAKSKVAGRYGTPLHLAIGNRHTETAAALLEDGFSEPVLPQHNVTPSKAQVLECNVMSTCNAFGQTPVMWALLCGQVEVFKLLIYKGGAPYVSDRDNHSLLAFEHCFVGGQASKLRQFYEVLGIEISGEGLRGALATLITQGLVDAHKVLCLCAISGDSVFLEDRFIELVASDDCVLPAALKGIRNLFFEASTFLNKLSVPDESSLNPLHISLLSCICCEMGLARPTTIGSINVKDHNSFITKLLSHPMLKDTVHENFPNGLSPLDLAQQFELHHIAALIEVAGGRPGVWADVPHDVFSTHGSELFMVTSSLMKLGDSSQGGHESVKKAVVRLLGGQTVESVVHVADDNWLVKEQVLGQHPDLGDIVKHVLPRIQARHWKRVGLALGMKKSTLDELGEHFSNDDDSHLETVSYWLEHGSSVTWKTLLDVLGHFETKHTVDELTDKIVSVLGGDHQVPLQLPSPSRSTGCIKETSSKRTAQLSCPLAKQKRTNTEGVPCQRKRSPEGDMQDQTSAKTARVVSEGAVAAERSSPISETKQVLDLFRDQFIADMDANAVVWELLYKDIIPRGAQERISKADEPKQRNEILHDWLQRTCTKEALMEACDIIVAVRGHPKMQTLGKAMKTRLHTGIPNDPIIDHSL